MPDREGRAGVQKRGGNILGRAVFVVAKGASQQRAWDRERSHERGGDDSPCEQESCASCQFKPKERRKPGDCGMEKPFRSM